MTRIAFLGLGAMGSRMAMRLVTAGHDVTVWSRTASAAEHLAAGAHLAPTPAAAVRDADVIFTMLADPTALEQVMHGPHGVAAELSEGSTVVEMSTVGPDAVTLLREALAPAVNLVDAPVLGSVDAAQDGTLVILAGGPPRVVEQVEPLLKRLGTVVRTGPVGSGAAAKLIANSVLLGVLTVLGEALALGRLLELPDDVMHDVLSRTPLAQQAQRRRPSIDAGNYPSRFALALARKDIDLAVRAASTRGVQLRAGRATAAWLADAVDSGRGTLDYTALLAQILEHPTPSPDTGVLTPPTP